jgi:hypothetical protein
LTFCKHLPVCNPSLGIKLLQEIQAHYDNNPKLEMLIEKLQMLMYSFMNKEYKVFWLRQWNEFGMLKGVPKTWFLGRSIRQMVAQGNILVTSKISNFLAWLSIFNMLSTFCLF